MMIQTKQKHASRLGIEQVQVQIDYLTSDHSMKEKTHMDEDDDDSMMMTT